MTRRSGRRLFSHVSAAHARYRERHRPSGFGFAAVAYYIGFDRASGLGNTVYLGLLHAVVDEAIRWGCRCVSFGRTALEPKAGSARGPSACGSGCATATRR
jgi:hypothetical protein